MRSKKEMSDTYFCGYDPGYDPEARCSTCRFFQKKHSYCRLNDSLTDAKYKCSGWEIKENKATHNHEVAELRKENARLRAALKPVLEADCQLDDYPTKQAYMAALEIVVSEAQRIYNEGEAK